MKKVLLVDTNISSYPIYSYLKSKGLKVFVIGTNPYDTLAKSTENYIKGDYSDEEFLIKAIKANDIDQIIPGCNDMSYRMCAHVNELLGKPFQGIESLKNTDTINNKDQFRDYAINLGLSVPKSFKNFETIGRIPVIIKPVDSYSGKGVTVLEKAKFGNFCKAVNKAKSSSKTDKVIIEEYVKGQLYSHSAFVVNQKIIQDFIVEEHGTVNPFVVDTSRVVEDFPCNLLNNIRSEIQLLCQNLKLTDGLIHTQFITDKKRHWLIEITKRCPGDLYSQLIEFSTKFPYAKAYTLPFLGHKMIDIPKPKLHAPIIRHTITTDSEKILYHVSFEQAVKIKRFYPLSLAGDNLKPSPLGKVGILFIEEKNQPEAIFNSILKKKTFINAK